MEYNSGIYSITNTVNGKFYIGSSRNFNRRKSEHTWELEKNRHSNQHLQNAWNKYGKKSFEFKLFELCEVSELLNREQFYLDNTQCYDHTIGYNIVKIAYQNTCNEIPVHQLDYVTLDIIDSFDSITQAESFFGGEKGQNIGNCIRGAQQTAYGFRWIKIGESPDIDNLKWYPKPVQKLDPITGEVLATYKSVKEANIQHGRRFDCSQITKALKGGTKKSCDAYWRFIGGEDPHLYCGIDPGKAGFITMIDVKYDRKFFFPIPMINKDYDISKLYNYLQSHRDLIIHVALEDVHAFHTAGSTASFEFGRGKGILQGIITAMNIPFTQIQAKAWQKETLEGVTKLYKYGKVNKKTGKRTKTVDTKATALIGVQRLFPNVDLRDPNRKTDRAKKPHDGLVDSLLIAEYCRRKFK